MVAATADGFAPFVGQCFLVGDHALDLRGIERHAQPPGAGHAGFTLIFHGPAHPVLPEGCHRFDLPDGDAATFHVMPIHTQTAGRQDYQAVFN